MAFVTNFAPLWIPLLLILLTGGLRAMIRSGRAELKDWFLGIELAVAAVAEGVIHLVTHLRSSPDGHVSVDYPDAFKALLWTLFCFL